ITTDGAAPLPAARVTFTPSAQGADPVETTSDESGLFRFEPAPSGAGQLRVEHDDFEPHEETLTLAQGQTTERPIALMPRLPAGQIRITARSFDGAPLQAQVLVAPGSQRHQTDAAGELVIDVEPGQYTVTIEAPGHRPQRRKAIVEDNGVTVLIVDLRRQR
ncbi:MAG: carboxypeptidase-like regulatory domain-containing protein, partial [Myxococcales bacterium]|nr:carboxypeptidase-like regulatory domain-containing protein [Myxococcales bacterium]